MIGKYLKAPVLTAVGLTLLALNGLSWNLFAQQGWVGWGLVAVGSVLFLTKKQ